MKLEFVCEYSADLREESDVIGSGPFGTRLVANVTGGVCDGPRLKGTILPSGGDWVLSDAKGVIRLDVRATIQTHDGANVYVQYYGVGRPNEPGGPAFGGKRPSEYGDHYFMTQPRFETGDERYQWLNELVCVGEGRLTEKGVAYRVYAVMND